MVALARAMLYDPRWGWHAAAELGGEVFAPPQYWRSQPSTQKALFGATHVRDEVARHSLRRANSLRHPISSYLGHTPRRCYALACARQTRFEKRTARGNPMEIGYFTMPSHPPECGLKEGHDWDLQTLRWLDELGYQEAWIGEHHTAPWEPHPSPDLLLGAGVFADQEYPSRPRRLPAALSPPGRTREPRRDARSPLRGPAEFRRRGHRACRATGRCSTSTACPARTAT